MSTRTLQVRLQIGCAIVLLALLTSSSVARSDEGDSFFSCRRNVAGMSSSDRSETKVNFYNGIAYFGGAAGFRLGAEPKNRWSRSNGFDTGIRDGFRLGSTKQRDDARLASDFTLVFSAAVLPALTIGAQFYRTHDCVETWDMVGDAVESMSLALFVTEAVKFAAGRERPYTEECDGSPPSDAKCGSDARHRSFFSGHASLAAAGAGLNCSYSLNRNAWGTSRAATAGPCALGVAAALTTGLLRLASDQHWGSDILLGFAVGAGIGYFDTWGPFDLLKFSTRGSDGKISSRGMVLPRADRGTLGAQVLMVF